MKYGLTTYRSYENKSHIVIIFVHGELISKSLPATIKVEKGLTYSESKWSEAPKRDLAVFRVINDKTTAQREILKEVMDL